MPNDPFHLAEVDHDELLRVLLDYFHSARGTAPRITRFQTEGSQHYLDVQMNRFGEITHIVRSKSFPRTELHALERVIASVLQDHGTAIGTIVAFATEEVQGWFRYRDRFQVTPVPAGAPTPTNKVVDDQPFLLQVAYKKSGNFQIDLMRMQREATIWGRILGLLLVGRIKLPSRYTQFAWVMDTLNPENVTSRWCRLGYVINIPFQQDAFESVDEFLPLPTMPAETYYRKSGYHSTFSLHIPEDLAGSLDAVMALTPVDREQFLKACEWYATYWQVAPHSSSTAYVALVTAIESLMKGGDQPVCELCGQPQYRLGKRFRDFIGTYAPFVEQSSAELRRLYDVRSDLIHGLELMEEDRAPWAFMRNWRGQYEQNLQRSLTIIVGVAIYNWLWSRAERLA